MNDKKLDQVEQLLRTRGGATLSAEFKNTVLEHVAMLPAPELLAPLGTAGGPAALLRCLKPGERLLALILLAALCLPILPAGADWLAALDYALSTAELTLSLGGTVISASLFSVAAALASCGLLAACGAYGARHRLLGA